MSTTPMAMPDVSTAPPPGGGGNVEDRFSDAFSSALSNGSEPSQAALVESAPAPESNAPEITEPETSADGADATATDPNLAANEEPDPFADLDDPGDQPALEAFLTTPRGREIYQGYKFVQELAKPTAQGGIGHAPTIQDVRQYFTDHQNTLAMRNDFTSGDPGALGKFFGHWFGPDRNGQPKASAMAALEHLEPTLAKFGADIYGQIANPVMSRTEAAMVEKWKAAPGNLKSTYYHTVQALHHSLTGEWLPEDLGTSGNRPANGQPSVDPGRAQLDAEWQRLNQAQSRARQEVEGQWNAQLERSEVASLSSVIDQALRPLAEVRTKTPEIYESLKDRMIGQVKTAMRADPQLWNLYQAKVIAARKTGDPAAVESVMKDYLALAMPIIRDKRNPFLKGAGVVIRQQNGDRHAQLRSVASHVAPANNGAPPTRSVVPSSKPKPGEDRDTYRERRIREAMSV